MPAVRDNSQHNNVTTVGGTRQEIGVAAGAGLTIGTSE